MERVLAIGYCVLSAAMLGSAIAGFSVLGAPLESGDRILWAMFGGANLAIAIVWWQRSD